MKNIFTRVVHAGTEIEKTTGAVMTPIFMTSTYAQSEPGVHKGYDYSRADNPTREAQERALAEIEDGAKYALAFASGLAAEQAIIQACLNPGDEVIVCDDVYGGTGRLFRRLFAKYGIEFQFLDLSSAKTLEKAISKKTKLVWIESPTNPTMKVIDIEAVVRIAKKAKALVVVDNTFATPVFQSPLKLGADLVIHSSTKYIGGHSDMIGGAVMMANKELFEQIKFVQFAAGAVPSPMESFLFLRSIKTLAVRMEKHAANALEVATFLESHKRVKDVYYPGLKSHPQHALAKKQMSGFSGMVSFNLQGSYKDVVKFLQKLKLFILAESLGGVESLVNHPEKMTHASVPEDLRKKLGIGPNLIRLSIGIEDAKDLIQDLKQALE